MIAIAIIIATIIAGCLVGAIGGSLLTGTFWCTFFDRHAEILAFKTEEIWWCDQDQVVKTRPVAMMVCSQCNRKRQVLLEENRE